MTERKASRSMRLEIVIEALKHKEREECAKIADTFAFFGETPEQTARAIAQAIRQRAAYKSSRCWVERAMLKEPQAEKREISPAQGGKARQRAISL
jgi:hypothetical protein